MNAKYESHGKVILIGEHSVVYDYDALALPAKNLEIKTTIFESHLGLWLRTHNYDGKLYDAPSEYAGIKYLIDEIIKKNYLDQHISLEFTGKIPEERGLGSSAAVAVGTIEVLNEHFGLDYTEQEIIDLANKAETINHGSASGLDVATVKSDYLVSFNKKSGPRLIRSKLGAFLVIADSGELGNTKEAVTLFRDQVTNETVKKNLLDDLGKIGPKAIYAWKQKDIVGFGDLMNQSQKILAEFKLSTPKLDELIKIALEAGALGSKLSGGGLGGIVISLAATKEEAEEIAYQQRNIINQTWIEDI